MTHNLNNMDDSTNIMESGVDSTKAADGTPRLLITKMVRDLHCISDCSSYDAKKYQIIHIITPGII